MKSCSMAPVGHCPHEATRTVRVDLLQGDRAMCQTHADWIVAQQMGRIVEATAFVPEWRKADLARDFTGRVLA